MARFKVKTRCQNCKRRYTSRKKKRPTAPKQCKHCNSTDTVAENAWLVE